MSYCRWSSDNWGCDLYIYESHDGFEIHIASRKRIFKAHLPERIPYPTCDEEVPEWTVKVMAREEEMDRLLDAADLVPIGLQYDGEKFCCQTAQECADQVEYLIGLGYRCPDYVVPTLREEALETDRQ